METKKQKQPQPQHKEQRPDNKKDNGDNSLNRGTQQPKSQTEVHEQHKVEEKPFERDPGQQKNPNQGNKAVVNEQEQDKVIEGDDMFEE